MSAEYAYVQGYWYNSDTMILPDDLILTRSEVEALHVDANTDVAPTDYLIYDGSVVPGTKSNK